MAIRTYTGFAAITRVFIDKYADGAEQLSQWVLANNIIDRFRIEQELVARMTPIFNELFNSGVQASNTLVVQEVAQLTNAMKVPFKYDKNVLASINGE